MLASRTSPAAGGDRRSEAARRGLSIVLVVFGPELLAFVLTGKRCWSIDLSRDEKTAIVANGLSDDITVIDVQAMQPVQSLPIGRVPHTVVIDD